jgi:hypothetical protein
MKVYVGILGLLLSATALAEEGAIPSKPVEGSHFKCTNVDLVRGIEVTSAVPGKQLPCAVTYSKITENPGSSENLWHSENDMGFCVQKAKEFVEKLKGWGWNCAPQ